MRRRAILLLAGGAIVACRAQTSTPPPQAAGAGPVIGDAASATRSESSPVSDADPSAVGPEAAPDAGSCQPELAMNDAPGAFDRYRFEAGDGRFGFRDASGKVVIEPRFRFAYEFSAGGVAPVVEEKRFSFIDPKGRVIAQAFPHDNGPDYFVEGRARILRNGQVGFIDRQGAIVIEPRWDFASPFCEGRAIVCRGCGTRWQRGQKTFGGGKWGYLDAQGKLVIALELDAAEPFSGGEARVVKRGRSMRIDRAGKELAVVDGG